MNKKQFTDAYANALKTQGIEIKIKEKGSLFILTEYNDEEYRHYLENAFSEFLQAPDSLEEIIEKYVRSSLEIYSENKIIDTSRIVPIIKDKGFIIEATNLENENKLELVYEEYNEALVIIYAEDKTNSISYFSKSDLLKTDINWNDLKQLAIENLMTMLPEIERYGEDGNYLLTAGGTYESSLIILDSLWNPGNFQVEGEIIVAIPNRDLLLISGSKDKNGLNQIKKQAKKFYQQGSYRITDNLFIWDNNKFILFK